SVAVDGFRISARCRNHIDRSAADKHPAGGHIDGLRGGGCDVCRRQSPDRKREWSDGHAEAPVVEPHPIAIIADRCYGRKRGAASTCADIEQGRVRNAIVHVSRYHCAASLQKISIAWLRRRSKHARLSLRASRI